MDEMIASPTPAPNLRVERAPQDPAQPFQRTHVIMREGRPVGFISVGVQPFKYMPALDVRELAEGCEDRDVVFRFVTGD